MTELKPCPFCGAAARLDYSCGEDDGGMFWVPECGNRECVIYGFRLSGPDYLGQEEAIAAWNRRAE